MNRLKNVVKDAASVITDALRDEAKRMLIIDCLISAGLLAEAPQGKCCYEPEARGIRSRAKV